jgi:hypothetical protein
MYNFCIIPIVLHDTGYDIFITSQYYDEGECNNISTFIDYVVSYAKKETFKGDFTIKFVVEDNRPNFLFMWDTHIKQWNEKYQSKADNDSYNDIIEKKIQAFTSKF